MEKIAEKIKGNREQGFTLIEVMAGLTLLSIVLLLANSVDLFGQKQMNVQTTEIQSQSDDRLAMKLITKEIRKAQTVEVNNLNELTIDSVDVYKLNGTTLLKNSEAFISNISKFTVSKNGNKITLTIGKLPETNIYLRE
ncbi:prepilin-type N-terminal cleavage/methylation domain-containing protein [Neobacillus sp. SAB-20_R2A]|uniref:prepilin-type N-terminal cleavage/methylation domain-containing protein n=1 Tax=Neobacillus sp. SAB-20_R2A TaxID=3120519 RepID=UPI003C6DD442